MKFCQHRKITALGDMSLFYQSMRSCCCRQICLIRNISDLCVNQYCASVSQFIGFCFWDGYDQENAPDWASNHAQLNISISDLNNLTNSEGKMV